MRYIFAEKNFAMNEKQLLDFIEKNQAISVSLAAVVFTFLGTMMTLLMNRWNMNSQLKVQVKTTIEKEWANNVRIYLTVLLTNCLILADRYGNRKDFNEPIKKEMMNAIASLFLLLNRDNKKQWKLINSIDNIGDLLFENDETEEHKKKILVALSEMTEAANKLLT